MRTFLIISITVISLNSYSQEGFRKITLKTFNWTFNLPTEFKVLDSSENEVLHKKGAKVLRETVGVNSNMKKTKTLINAMKDRFSLFNATLRPLNPQQIQKYGDSLQTVKDLVYKAMQEKTTNGTVDSASSIQKIDGVLFDKFTVITTLPNIKIGMVILSKLYKGYDFGITYVYVDDKTKGQIEGILESSRFKK